MEHLLYDYPITHSLVSLANFSTAQSGSFHQSLNQGNNINSAFLQFEPVVVAGLIDFASDPIARTHFTKCSLAIFLSNDYSTVLQQVFSAI